MAAPWITRADLPTGLPGGEAGLDAAAALASSVLYGLSGRRWAGTGTRALTVYPSHGVPGYPVGPGCLPVPVICAGEILNHSRCDRPPAIRLPDYPVTEVAEVTVGGAVREPDSYRLTGGRFLEDAWGGWRCCDSDARLTVTYAYGETPPDAGRAAAVRLATELAKALDGQPTGLPGYITQRVRQGETVSYTSAAALFDKGRTGLAEVDVWLATVNPGGIRRRASSWSPDTDPRFTTTGGSP